MITRDGLSHKPVACETRRKSTVFRGDDCRLILREPTCVRGMEQTASTGGRARVGVYDVFTTDADYGYSLPASVM